MPEPFELSVAEAALLIRRRELSPLELAESLLGRIDAFEPKLKAWVYLDREAVLSEARQMERQLESGQEAGPLHGVPIGLKDIYYTAGIPTTACSKLYADFVPEYDAIEPALVGAHIFTIPGGVLAQMEKHPLTDIGIAAFLEDAKKFT